MNFSDKHNARLRGWQRIPLNSNTTTATTAAQWDWKRHALTVPFEAFVRHFLFPENHPRNLHKFRPTMLFQLGI
ncbi:hypothetical protein, partial [Vibrio cholerae]|uniref:hypothetical protein n=1 Tax=Vibrio cholerae TaxID=666 RepID=UPI001F29D9BF